ncbi:MAG: hypothetical protein U0L72_10655 [Acutalibacteraceae bacterium]|nr:hypothetical protein [Acutalibacteraceae bacterium]
MSFVIVLYVACLIMECVLLMKYRMNIDLSRKFTVISRFLYCIGFVSIAVNFMLPVQKLEDTDNLMNQPPEDDDLLFSTSESNEKNNLKQIRTSKNVCQVTMSMILYYRVSTKILPYI